MNVYVLQTGNSNWDEMSVRGVFATPEAAISAWPQGEWKRVNDDRWENGLTRCDDEAIIQEWDVQD